MSSARSDHAAGKFNQQPLARWLGTVAPYAALVAIGIDDSGNVIGRFRPAGSTRNIGFLLHR